MKRLMLALACVMGLAQPAEPAIVSSTGSLYTNSSPSTTVSCALPSNVPAGATIVVGVLERSDVTTTLSQVEDGTNGVWTLTNRVSGPTDLSTSHRSWLVARENSAAITTPATVTVTVSASVNLYCMTGWIDLDASTSALTFNAFATPLGTTTASTDVDSNTVANASAGAIVGFVATINNLTSLTGDTGEDTISTVNTTRLALMFEDHAAGGGPYGFVTTPNTATGYAFHVVSYSEPAAGSAPDTKKGLLLFVGEEE